MKNYAFLFWAYVVIWACLSVFVLTSLIRIRRLDQRLDRIERDLARTDPDPPA